MIDLIELHKRLKETKASVCCDVRKLEKDFMKHLKVRQIRDGQQSRFTNVSKISRMIKENTRVALIGASQRKLEEQQQFEDFLFREATHSTLDKLSEVDAR